ncbi:hypothetical protein ONE63_009872 [Megalurothrips usitatus]|uniref:tRNA-splicing endonuclease subunit Sen15 domain-containing protein n=1 Tax=Megalurothrips usitatus TaxID=439358 RepID=A0AAV7XG21_9NEOP|nr:hypothetical protein ONE63_009872 [Megalurothrips usitatus]
MDAKIHPVLKQLLDFGCRDQRCASVAFAVYMDLSEVKAVWDLRYDFCKDLDIIYLTGREQETMEPNVYIPLSASQTVSPEWLCKVQKALPTQNRGLTLAFKDADSTIVYYNVTEGLETPDSPETVQNKKSVEEKKKLMQAELWRKRNVLYSSAKSNNSNEEL